MKKKIIKLIPFVVGPWIFASQVVAVTVPPKLFSRKVETFTIEHNGTARIVKASEKISIALGDQFKVTDVELQGSHERKSKPVVNIIGFNGGKNDLGKLVHSDRDLIKKWSVDKKGLTYKVRAEDKSKELGEFFIEIKEPVLRYLVVEVNGVERVVHSKDRLVLKKTDTIKVNRIATNIKENDTVAEFSMKPLMGPHGVDGIDFYKLQIKRKDVSLASVTVVVNQ